MRQRAANRYAHAIIDLAEDQKSMDKLLSEVNTIEDTLKASRDLKAILNSPVIKNEDKLNIVKEVFKKSDKMLLNLFGVLAENNRFDHLASICKAYTSLYNLKHNIQEAHVSSAIELDKATLDALKVKIKQITGSEAILTTSVNKELLGGFVLKVNDLQYDASISGQLKKIERSLYQ
jgi:F-type H+-transporting ATPase subunit delta